MTYEELLLDEVCKWDIQKLNLIYTNPIIFVCGGSLEKELDETDQKYSFESLRQYFIDHAFAHNSSLNLRTAEELKDYLKIYNDLLEFESDIANVCDLILIILESSGSLTELGVFIGNEEFSKKLVVIRNRSHSQEDSFINLGPLLVLKNLKDNSVLDYDWPYDKKFKTLQNETLKLICEDISDHLKSSTTQ